MVSACSNPGSRRCTCMSMKPGATIMPVASNTSAFGEERLGATPAMRPSTISTSATRSVCDAGSITRPFLMTIDMAYPITFSSTAMRTAMPFSTWLRITERWKSATSRGELAAAIDGPRMHHDGVGLGQVQMLQPQAVEPEILARRKGRFVLPLQLHAQHHDHVGIADGFANVGGEAHARAPVAPAPRGSSDAGPHSTISAPNLDSRCTLERATRLCAMSPMMATRRPSRWLAAVENGARVEQRLGGMFVRAVAGVDDGRGQVARQKVRRAARPRGASRWRRAAWPPAYSAYPPAIRPWMTLEPDAVMETASAPRRLAAISKLVRVRVEAS